MLPNFATKLKHLLTMKQLKQIQSQLIISGAIYDPFYAGKLIEFCTVSNSGDLSHAHTLFNHLPQPTLFIYNTMIRSFAEKNLPFNALFLYKKILQPKEIKPFLPNNYTFSFILRACADLRDLKLGFVFHSQIVRLGWESYDFVQNGLIHLYATCGDIDCARKLFDIGLDYRDVVTWTALINGYVKSGEICVARGLFDEMPVKNSVSWSAMINGYVQVGFFKEALELFSEMQSFGVRPNHAGIVGALTACANLGTLDQGKWIHAYVNRNKLELDRVLGTALVDMYAKCGCIETSLRVFEEMPVKDVFAYTSLISGLANHNQGKSALKLFYRMQDDRVCPNRVTLICVLSACGRMGLVDEGLRIFYSIKENYGFEPGVEHYGCLVDLLGKAGMLEDAKKVVQEMPMEPDSYVLGALLNACGTRGDVEFGHETVKCLMDKSLDHGGVHVLLSNMYAHGLHWDGVSQVRKDMEDRNVRKVPGCSLIEVDGLVCEFVAGDQSHVFRDDILLLLIGVDKNLRSFWVDDDDYYDDDDTSILSK